MQSTATMQMVMQIATMARASVFLAGNLEGEPRGLAVTPGKGLAVGARAGVGMNLRLRSECHRVKRLLSAKQLIIDERVPRAQFFAFSIQNLHEATVGCVFHS
jgi:hypothetical protein